jgi:thiol-disulfide isomerase/thioredoxin
MPSPGVLVFVMAHCPACVEFKPRLARVSEPFRQAGLAVQVGDLDSNPKVRALADKHKVRVTPTILAFDRHGRVHKREGSLPDAELRKLLDQIRR